MLFYVIQILALFPINDTETPKRFKVNSEAVYILQTNGKYRSSLWPMFQRLEAAAVFTLL